MITHQVSKTANLIGVLCSDPEVVEQLVKLAVISMVEANTDMVVDCSEDYTCKSQIDAAFGEELIRAQVNDYLTDVLEDFSMRVLQEVDKVRFTARVRGLDYTAAGELNDVTVDVAF
jgi:hypothetical protein